jgi:hypothetical protein
MIVLISHRIARIRDSAESEMRATVALALAIRKRGRLW